MKGVLALSLILALFFPIQAFANASGSGYSNQVVYHPEPQNIEPDSSGLYNGTDLQDKLRIQKAIKQTGQDLFEISLILDMSRDFTPALQPGISVVLVLDNSASMLEPFSGDQNRAQALKEAVFEFVDIFLGEAASPDNEIAIVSYDSDLDLFGCFDFNSGDVNVEAQAAKNAIDYAIFPNTNGSTNIQIAMKQAREYAQGANNKDKYIILFSDGAPNHSYNGISGAYTNKITSVNGYEFDFYVKDFGNYTPFSGYQVLGKDITDPMENDMLATISESLICREEGINVFSVFIYGDSTMEEDKKKAEFVMQNMASEKRNFFETSNISGLIGAFERIALGLMEEAAVWFIEDPMGEGITYRRLRSVNGVEGSFFKGVEYESGLRMLLCNLSNLYHKPMDLAEDQFTKRIKITYEIKFESDNLRKNDPSYSERKPYPTNKKTVLDYYLAAGSFSKADIKKAYFDIPEVASMVWADQSPPVIVPPPSKPETSKPDVVPPAPDSDQMEPGVITPSPSEPEDKVPQDKVPGINTSENQRPGSTQGLNSSNTTIKGLGGIQETPPETGTSNAELIFWCFLLVTASIVLVLWGLHESQRKS